MLRVLSLSMQSNITLVTIMASCAGFLLFFFVVAFLHFHEYLDYHCLRDRDFFSSKTLITILPPLHYQLHYHIAPGLAIPKIQTKGGLTTQLIFNVLSLHPNLRASQGHWLSGWVWKQSRDVNKDSNFPQIRICQNEKLGFVRMGN